jgi:NAD(P)-dependent dehydrogenase (short-subunit alcohol dehydrogenase family)
MAGRLLGKVAVVTGAAPRGEGVGNGMATAILFAREGAKVVLVNRSAEPWTRDTLIRPAGPLGEAPLLW